MKYVIGVDGGGTKTESFSYDVEGNALNRGLSGFGNLNVNEEEAINNIIISVKGAMDNLRPEDCEYIILGVAGSEVGENALKIEKALRTEFGCRVKCLNDADIGLAALFEGGDGVMTIGGTGSISIGVKGDVKKSTGGYGHLLGDEGSGYSVATMAIRKMLQDEDEGNVMTPLSKAILEQLSAKDASDVVSYVYAHGKADVASLTPVVVDMAKKGDEFSREILIQTGKEAATTTLRCINKLGIKENYKVGIVGSVLIKAKLVRETFENTLKEALGENVTIIESVGSPAKGGYYIAKKELR